MDRIPRCAPAPARGPARAAQRPVWWQSTCTFVHLYFCFVSIKNIYMSTKNIYISTHPPTVPRYPLSSMKSLGSTGVASHSRDWALGYKVKVLIIIINYYLSIPLSCIQRTLRGWLARSTGSQYRTEQALLRPGRCGPASCAESGQSNSLNHNHDMTILYLRV